MKNIFFALLVLFVSAQNAFARTMTVPVSEPVTLDAGEYIVRFARPEKCNPGEMELSKSYNTSKGAVVYKLVGRVISDRKTMTVCRVGMSKAETYLDLRDLGDRPSVTVVLVQDIDVPDAGLGDVPARMKYAVRIERIDGKMSVVEKHP